MWGGGGSRGWGWWVGVEGEEGGVLFVFGVIQCEGESNYDSTKIPGINDG